MTQQTIPPDSDALAAYRQRLRVEFHAYLVELAKAHSPREQQAARRAYHDAIAGETAEYRRDH
jgi:hypothetical protein